ncbi:MAG: permease [Acidimicrobiales bacterium]
MTELALVTPILDIGRGLREGLLMFWETLWALVLGFSLSGAVQAFVSKDQMLAKLGRHRPAEVTRAAGYGMVSSSCSYAASAMSKSLFAKGADVVAALVFMVASTNLVVELGIVLLVLLGWQFMTAEFIGGTLMIVLLALAGGFVFSTPLVEVARTRLAKQSAWGPDLSAAPEGSTPRSGELAGRGLSAKLRSPAALSDAAGYAVADATMLRRELLIGYTVAGFLAVLMPTGTWNALFIHGHGFWTVGENALVGPLIAAISCVCSIGNVPLAAALWSGGISFGGVIAFIFADLITLPLIFIYRKYYGLRLTVRIVGLLYAVMVVAGLATEGIFRLLGAVPAARTIHLASTRFTWNYTSYLDIVFVGVAALVWWLAHNRARLGGGFEHDTDPVCGMQVRIADAPAQAEFENRNYRFCSDRCRDRFVEHPARYTGAGSRDGETFPQGPVAVGRTRKLAASGPVRVIDPVCGMTVDPQTAPAHRVLGDDDYWFCSPGCAAAFDGGEAPGMPSGAKGGPDPGSVVQ